ncbi:proline-rich receptor-like protein kinase PERK2 [Iris pallida]|uniref:Proline-rich receptor-like protein kinase PERK2 n=1 Tax=Iris pallida TaxID=29817 RepID=A0AAX6DUJ7_IRIPA|nr:proline-rich receptor-like protein kinase PERK2 [Iris pallida]
MWRRALVTSQVRSERRCISGPGKIDGEIEPRRRREMLDGARLANDGCSRARQRPVLEGASRRAAGRRWRGRSVRGHERDAAQSGGSRRFSSRRRSRRGFRWLRGGSENVAFPGRAGGVDKNLVCKCNLGIRWTRTHGSGHDWCWLCRHGHD